MDTFDEWKWLILAGLITFGGLLALGAFNSLWGIAFFALSGFARSATSPLAEKMVLRHTPAPCRATILSIASFLYRLLLAAVEPGIGLIGDHWGLPTAFLVMAVVFGISMLLILIGWNRVRQPQVQPG
jgi:MFS family permease